MRRPRLGLGWDSEQLEWRLAALAVVPIPLYGFVLPVAYAPMYLAGLGVLLLVVRLVRAVRSRRAPAT